MMASSEKIQADHLARTAFIYVRQSTLDQVRHHHESRRRQYDLAQYARALGWREVVVIDDDLGKSGASAAGRLGFQRLVAEVSLGHAGAVFGLEVSRLARNNRDWYQLLDLCSLMDTLIVDAEGVYDPRLPNDRLLLGLKGTLSEVELGWIRQRAHAGLLAKAQRGELLLGVPVGYVQTADGHLEKHPDRRIQDAIALVFAKFAELGSVRQALLWFRDERVALPALEVDHGWGTHVVWRLPVYNTVLKFLTNPTYAGAYAFGRTETRTRVVDGAPRKTRGHRRERAAWTVLLRDHHAGYVSWETYERIQQVLADNANMKGLMGARGAVRRGPSLLAGVLRCGQCGRRIHVAYGGTGGRVVRYSCRGANLNHGTAPCLAFGGLRVDAAIEREVLRVLTPGAIEAAVARGARATDALTATERAVERELQQARYEAERARRQYDAVEPEHRLVADTLEQRWNAALEQVAGLEQRLEALAGERAQQTPAVDRERLLALARDLPAVWTHPAADHRTKKRLLRLLIEEIVARPAEQAVDLVIHWKGGKHTMLRVARNRLGRHRRCTDAAVVDVVRELARVQPDGQIARVLNRLGYRTGADNAWAAGRVQTLRSYHRIAAFDPAVDGTAFLTMERAAAELSVSAMTIRRLITAGVLTARQPMPYAPWIITREALGTDRVQRAIAAVKRGRPLPQTAPAGQLTLANSTT